MNETEQQLNNRKRLRGMGRIFKRNDTWWIAYYHNGREIRESSRSINDAATKLLKKRLGEIASRRFVGPSEERVKFEDLATGYERDYELWACARSEQRKLELSICEHSSEMTVRVTSHPNEFADTRHNDEEPKHHPRR